MERTGYHVGNALELEALWPAENTGKRRQKVPLGGCKVQPSDACIILCGSYPAQRCQMTSSAFTSAFLSVIVFSVFYKGNR